MIQLRRAAPGTTNYILVSSEIPLDDSLRTLLMALPTGPPQLHWSGHDASCRQSDGIFVNLRVLKNILQPFSSHFSNFVTGRISLWTCCKIMEQLVRALMGDSGNYSWAIFKSFLSLPEGVLAFVSSRSCLFSWFMINNQRVPALEMVNFPVRKLYVSQVTKNHGEYHHTPQQD